MSIFRRLFSRDRPEVQANTLTTSKQLEDVLIRYGTESRSGVVVTPEVALMVSAVSSATSVLSETVAQIPLMLYRRVNGERQRAVDVPLYRVLHDKPNGWQNSFEFREMMTLHLLLWGNCYAFINRVDGNQRVRELLPIHPDRVQVKQDKDTLAITYTVVTPGGKYLELPQSRMFHIRDRSVNGYEGRSRLKDGRDSVGLALVAERWGAQLFKNGARPSGVLRTDNKVGPEVVEQLAESWKSAHGGENALGTAVLDNGFKWEALVMNNRDAQFLETRKFQINEVARIYRVPPHMIGDLERATFSNIEHQSLDFVKFSLMPWLKRWESAINAQLIQSDGVYAEFVTEGLLRGDSKSRAEFYASALQNQWMTANEVRERENLPRVEGGDVLRNPAINPQGAQDEPAQTA